MRPDYSKHAQMVVDKIDGVSRIRALTDEESRLLEFFIGIVDGSIPPARRIPFRGNIILARMGIKRDITMYNSTKTPNKRVTSRAVVLRKVRGQ